MCECACKERELTLEELLCLRQKRRGGIGLNKKEEEELV